MSKKLELNKFLNTAKKIHPEYDFKKQFEIDKWKKQKCEEENIKLIYFAKEKNIINDYLGEIFTSEKELLDYLEYLLLNKNNKV